MKIGTLRRYPSLIANIRAMETQIETYYNPVSSPNGKQSSGSGSSSPLPGNPTERAAFQIIEMREELEKRKAEQERALYEIETWIHSIHDVEIESIVRWHFLLCETWANTNEKIFGYADKQYCRRKFVHFCKSHPELFEPDPEFEDI